ncbi:MAG TPA: hypothetical protein VFA07_14325 [Chthonomonadaceae bacterium]|nr:hypothetical protein [Chthonomonadaceae bacterium]
MRKNRYDGISLLAMCGVAVVLVYGTTRVVAAVRANHSALNPVDAGPEKPLESHAETLERSLDNLNRALTGLRSPAEQIAAATHKMEKQTNTLLDAAGKAREKVAQTPGVVRKRVQRQIPALEKTVQKRIDSMDFQQTTDYMNNLLKQGRDAITPETKQQIQAGIAHLKDLMQQALKPPTRKKRAPALPPGAEPTL